MTKVISIQKNQTSTLFPVVKSTNTSFTQTDFMAAYGDKTPAVMVSMLDAFYTSYKLTEEYQYLSFADKVDIEFRFEVLRRFIQSLKR